MAATPNASAYALSPPSIAANYNSPASQLPSGANDVELPCRPYHRLVKGQSDAAAGTTACRRTAPTTHGIREDSLRYAPMGQSSTRRGAHRRV